MTSVFSVEAGECVICAQPLEVEGYTTKKILRGVGANTYEQTCAECNPAIRCSWWNPGCNCLWSCIPDDVMVKQIFCFFDARELACYSRVCRRWQSLCQTTALYKTVNLERCPPYTARERNSQSRESDALIAILKRHGRTALSTIKLCGLGGLSVESLTAISTLAMNLQELHFCNNLSLRDEAVVSIVQNCHNLRNLQSPGCLCLSDDAIAQVAHSQLRVLNIARCKITISGLRRMCGGSGRLTDTLRSLNIARCPNLNSDAIQVIANTLGQLRDINAHSVELDSTALRALVKGCPSLESLDISADAFFENAAISDDDLVYLAGLNNLRCLAMEGFTEVTAKSIAELLTTLKSLEYLNLSGCVAIAFEEELHTALESSQLQGLTLSGTAANDETVASVSRLPLHCLDLNDCNQLTSDCVDLFARLFRNLKKLDIGLCSGIEAHRLAWLLEQRPDLEVTHY